MNYDLEELFALLDGAGRGGVLPERVPLNRGRDRPYPPGQMELFDRERPGGPAVSRAGAARSGPGGLAGPEGFPPAAAELARLSADAYGAFLLGWMSGLPIGAELVRFGRKVIAGGRGAAEGAAEGAEASGEKRLAAETAERREAGRAATDRGDPDARAVLEAAAKVRREIHRLLGFLRFRADGEGRYVARCAPDYFVLPALAPHFLRRFGELPWAIIDEWRGLCLVRPPGEEPELIAGGPGRAGAPGADPWEDLWRLYHRSVNIENRKNPGLQRQLMPSRYWKYLPEMAGNC